MGFIQYHGTKEDHYGDVTQYADIQAEMERQKRDEVKKQEWFASVSGETQNAAADTNVLIKLTAKAYRDAADRYRKLGLPAQTGTVDLLQLWEDLWLFSTEKSIEEMDIPEEKQEQLLHVMKEKVLHLEGATSAERHFAERENRKYRRYLQGCFAGTESHPSSYWSFLAEVSSGDNADLQMLIRCQERYCLYLKYYLYKSTHPRSDHWMRDVEQNKKILEATRKQLQWGKQRKPLMSKLQNPLYRPSLLEAIILFSHALLFHIGSPSGQEDLAMIEDLYTFLKEYEGQPASVTSILPEGIGRQIMEGKLPVFADSSITGLQPGENIHYINHVIAYKPTESGEEPFELAKGTIAITDKRIAFRSVGINDISLADLDRVTQYDMTPGIMVFQGRGQACYVTLPDLQLAYRVLQMIANPDVDQTKGQTVQVPFSYEELVEKADLGACIFAFECLESYPFPSKLKDKIRLLLKKLHGLQTAVENHPERANEVQRFLIYYLPEEVRLMLSYHEYQSAEMNEAALQKTYTMITDSIDTLDAAVEQKILNIYNMEAMETRAKADALKQILEQDGYFQGSQILKH